MAQFTNELVVDGLDFVYSKLLFTLNEAGDKIFHFVDETNGVHWTNGSGWTDGFWIGQLLLVGDYFRDRNIISVARRLQTLFEKNLKQPNRLTHDVGFLYQLSSVLDDKLHGDQFSRGRALIAAESLAGRFHEKGKFIVAWNQSPNDDSDFNKEIPGKAIIDCMMNLPLLLYASRETGNTRYAEIAHAHAHTSSTVFFRDDGSTYHTFNFDPVSGCPLQGKTHQGFSDNSCWSRGQAWAIYGFALMYRNTGVSLYAETARRALNWWVEHIPESTIAPWDFHADTQNIVDTSASLIAACGMLEMIDSNLLTGVEREKYQQIVERTILEVIKGYLRPSGVIGVVEGGVSHFPNGVGISTCLVYSDYFYVECLLRLLGQCEVPWVVR